MRKIEAFKCEKTGALYEEDRDCRRSEFVAGR
jgi:hypothetical protein